MSIQDAVILPNGDVPVAKMPREEALERDNVLLRDMNRRQEETIRELRAQYTALAGRENDHQTELEKEKDSLLALFRESEESCRLLRKELREKDLWLESKDIMINAQQETIDAMNAKDRLFVKLVDDRFQKTIGDQ